MSETGIEKRPSSQLKEKGQYAFGFGVIALMLYAAGLPLFLLIFVGALSFFVWKIFASENRNETRGIFEFYLSANEILRDDDRRWYGFEIQETIARGERIIRSMSAAPPLVYFGLGALYQKLGDHASAVRNLANVVEETTANESAIVFPTRELREYVRMLRKIERAPAEAPLTSSAIRSLERSRRNRGKELLELSRTQVAHAPISAENIQHQLESIVDRTGDYERDTAGDGQPPVYQEVLDREQAAGGGIPFMTPPPPGARPNAKETTSPPRGRQTISEVLHDIYDKNIQ